MLPRRQRNSSELGDVPPVRSGRQPPVPPRRSGRNRKRPDRLGDCVMYSMHHSVTKVDYLLGTTFNVVSNQ